jgi:hypothetical protein
MVTTKAVIAAIGTKLFLAKIIIAYAVTYSVTYIATGSAKAAQSAGLSAALLFQRIVYCIAVSIITLCVIWRLNIGISTEESSNLWVIHSTVI